MTEVTFFLMFSLIFCQKSDEKNVFFSLVGHKDKLTSHQFQQHTHPLYIYGSDGNQKVTIYVKIFGIFYLFLLITPRRKFFGYQKFWKWSITTISLDFEKKNRELRPKDFEI